MVGDFDKSEPLQRHFPSHSVDESRVQEGLEEEQGRELAKWPHLVFWPESGRIDRPPAGCAWLTEAPW